MHRIHCIDKLISTIAITLPCGYVIQDHHTPPLTPPTPHPHPVGQSADRGHCKGVAVFAYKISTIIEPVWDNYSRKPLIDYNNPSGIYSNRLMVDSNYVSYGYELLG